MKKFILLFVMFSLCFSITAKMTEEEKQLLLDYENALIDCENNKEEALKLCEAYDKEVRLLEKERNKYLVITISLGIFCLIETGFYIFKK